jgi:hypothetical protein
MTTNLQLGGEQLEDVIDLVLETPREHLVGLVQDKHLRAWQNAWAWTSQMGERKHMMMRAQRTQLPIPPCALDSSCLDAVSPEAAPAEHVIDASGRAHDDMDTSAQNASVLANAGSTDAGVALDLQVIAERPHDLLDLLGELARRREDQGLAFAQAVIDVVQNTGAESGRLSSPGLCLLDHVEALGEGNNTLLLDR